MAADVEFFWDPICPFAWLTSQWIDEVARLRGLRVGWRFLSLRFLNEHVDYRKFPEGYGALHEQGLRMARVTVAARERHGDAAMAPMITAIGESIWEVATPPGLPSALERAATPSHLTGVLAAAGLDTDLAGAADDDRFDAVLRADTAEALDRSGGEVGTPIVSLSPPAGPAFFGPVISSVPRGGEALALYDALVTLTSWPGFAEVKRRRAPLDLPLVTGAGRR